MTKRKMNTIVLAVLLVLSIVPFSAFASSNQDDSVIGGYVYNPITGTTQTYYSSPAECLPDLSKTCDKTPYIAAQPRGVARAFYSYSPSTQTYDYTNSRYKIGLTRLDNSSSAYPTSFSFRVEKSGSCGVVVTNGLTIGGETDALFAKAEAEYGNQVSRSVSWYASQSAGAETSVPAGKIGTITGYVIGVYSQGTATYTRLNTTTDELVYETVGMGGLVPTNSEWNLVVNIS